jgi:hypothetical protein
MSSTGRDPSCFDYRPILGSTFNDIKNVLDASKSASGNSIVIEAKVTSQYHTPSRIIACIKSSKKSSLANKVDAPERDFILAQLTVQSNLLITS